MVVSLFCEVIRARFFPNLIHSELLLSESGFVVIHFHRSGGSFLTQNTGEVFTLGISLKLGDLVIKQLLCIEFRVVEFFK